MSPLPLPSAAPCPSSNLRVNDSPQVSLLPFKSTPLSTDETNPSLVYDPSAASTAAVLVF